jgi:phosphate transport system substrate-binding protein
MRAAVMVAAFGVSTAWAQTAPATSAAKPQASQPTTGQSAKSGRVDPSLPDYRAVPGISGSIKSVGSGTMNNLMGHWREEFNRFYPGVRIEVEGKGSGLAPTALASGASQFGPMSREMKASEIEEFERGVGHKPTQLRVGIDCIAIFVHRDNPLNELTMAQARRVFSVDGASMTWGDLGLTDPALRDRPIGLFGRLSNSGTYGYFKEHVLENADFKKGVREMEGNAGVVQAVGADRFAMGYASLGYKTADVKPLRIKGEEGGAIMPSYETAESGEYPIARFLYVYLNHAPGQKLDPLRAEFVRMMLSRVGQECVLKDGYFPISASVALEELAKVGLEPVSAPAAPGNSRQ